MVFTQRSVYILHLQSHLKDLNEIWYKRASVQRILFQFMLVLVAACLHGLLVYTEDGGNTLLRNMSEQLPNHDLPSQEVATAVRTECQILKG